MKYRDKSFINHQPRVIYDHARGSQSLFWDANGKPIQYIHYAPYGELIANQQTIGYDERFKFMGKERDWETGYDCFGARYYDFRKGFRNPKTLALYRNRINNIRFLRLAEKRQPHYLEDYLYRLCLFRQKFNEER